MSDLTIVILAAGKGSRMNSEHPKVLQRLAGCPMLQHVLQAARGLQPAQIICVVGEAQDAVKQALAPADCIWVEQKQVLGTGHAVMQALPYIKTDRVLVLLGDVPLITTQTLRQFVQEIAPDALGLISYHAENPQGFGRILRNEHHLITGVVEEKDANDKQRLITEVASGIYLARQKDLKTWLPQVHNHNASGEYYLPDIVPIAAKQTAVVGMVLADRNEALGVNNKAQLAHAERTLQQRYAQQFLDQGVTLLDPKRLDIRGEVTIGRDVVLDVNVILEGKVIIGDRCVIGPNTVLKNVTLGEGCEIKANTVIEEATIAAHVNVGPFARIRPGTTLAEGARIGNFVEVKNAQMGKNSKANHLSYIGDAIIGQDVNIGAGTITCNYDGVNKHRTIIEDNASIGANSSLVAPVTVGFGATIGAGTVLTKDAPKNQLTIARAKQASVPNWERPQKKKEA